MTDQHGNTPIDLAEIERRLRLSEARTQILESFVKSLLERSGLQDAERLDLWFAMASHPTMTADELMERAGEFTPLALQK